MDEIKSKLSLALLTSISPLIRTNSENFSLKTNESILFVLTDKNSNYDFYFRAEKEQVDRQNEIIITFTSKPFSELTNSGRTDNRKLMDFVQALTDWFVNVEKYKTEKLLDDSIEREYQEEFYNDFKIVDEDAETHRFNFQQQLLLLSYIENLEDFISEEQNEFIKEDKEELLNESASLKRLISTETKDKFMKSLGGMWAKIRKKSLRFCEFVIKEFAKEFIKHAAEKGIPISWNSLPTYVEHIKQLLE